MRWKGIKTWNLWIFVYKTCTQGRNCCIKSHSVHYRHFHICCFQRCMQLSNDYSSYRRFETAESRIYHNCRIVLHTAYTFFNGTIYRQYCKKAEIRNTNWYVLFTCVLWNSSKELLQKRLQKRNLSLSNYPSCFAQNFSLQLFCFLFFQNDSTYNYRCKKNKD